MRNKFSSDCAISALKNDHILYSGSLIICLLTCCFYFWLTTSAMAASPNSDIEINKSDSVRFYLGLEERMTQGQDIKDVESATNIWLTWAGEEFKTKPKTFIYKDVDLLAKDFFNGKLDFIVTTSLNYFKLINRKDAELELGPAGAYNGSILVKYLLISRQDLKYASISDLKGKSLALQLLSDVERLFINTLLLRDGLSELNDFFGVVIEKQRASRAILDVFFGQVDVCMVPEHVYRTMIELNPQIGQQTKVLAASPELMPGVTCFQKNSDPRLKDLMKTLVPKMKDSEKGKQMLMMYKIDNVSQIRESDLDQLKALVSEYEKLKRQSQNE